MPVLLAGFKRANQRLPSFLFWHHCVCTQCNEEAYNISAKLLIVASRTLMCLTLQVLGLCVMEPWVHMRILLMETRFCLLPVESSTAHQLSLLDLVHFVTCLLKQTIFKSKWVTSTHQLLNMVCLRGRVTKQIESKKELMSSWVYRKWTKIKSLMQGLNLQPWFVEMWL